MLFFVSSLITLPGSAMAILGMPTCLENADCAELNGFFVTIACARIACKCSPPTLLANCTLEHTVISTHRTLSMEPAQACACAPFELCGTFMVRLIKIYDIVSSIHLRCAHTKTFQLFSKHFSFARCCLCLLFRAYSFFAHLGLLPGKYEEMFTVIFFWLIGGFGRSGKKTESN